MGIAGWSVLFLFLSDFVTELGRRHMNFSGFSGWGGAGAGYLVCATLDAGIPGAIQDT